LMILLELYESHESHERIVDKMPFNVTDLSFPLSFKRIKLIICGF